MTRGVFILLFCFIQVFTCKGQTWTSAANCPKKLDHAVGFSFGAAFYIGTGNDSIYHGAFTNAFYKYDIIQNSWSQISNFPGAARCQAVSFVIGNKAYVGLGNSNTTCFNDFYEYDISADTWTQKSSCPIPYCSYFASSAFSLNGKGYVMTSADNAYQTTAVLQYNPQTDTWTPKNNFPGSQRCDAVALSLNSKGYFGMGRVWNVNYSALSDIWEYDDLNDTWVFKTSHPNGSNFWVAGLTKDNEIYIGGGGLPATNLIMKYSPSNNQWTNVLGFPTIRHASQGFSYDCEIYVCAGYGSGGNLNDLKKLQVDSTCNQLAVTENTLFEAISIDPNPTSERLILTWDGLYPALVEIIDVTGSLIHKYEISSGESISVADLNNAMYYLKWTGNGKSSVSRFIKN